MQNSKYNKRKQDNFEQYLKWIKYRFTCEKEKHKRTGYWTPNNLIDCSE